MLLCNPNFSAPSPCVSSIDLSDSPIDQATDWDGNDYALNVFQNTTDCPGFEGWTNIFGSPDYSYPGLVLSGSYTPTDNTLVRMMSSGAYISTIGVCCQRTEGIMTDVNLVPGNQYLVSYLREVYSNFDTPTQGQGGGSSCDDNWGFGGLGSNQLDWLHLRLTNQGFIT